MSDLNTSPTMNVPEHIYVAGDPSNSKTKSSQNFVEEMRVPDRIIIGGGNQHVAGSIEPIEVLQDRILSSSTHDEGIHVPQVLTANDYPYEKANNRISQASPEISQASIAIDENPLRELKKMRRLVAGLSNQLQNLEKEQNNRWNNLSNWNIGVTLVAIFEATIILFYVLKRR